MAIIKNLKPLKHTRNDSREELLIRLDKWATWYETTSEKIGKDYKEELAGYKHREVLRQAEVTQERNSRLKDGFKCECHSWIDTINKLHDELVSKEVWKKDVMYVVNDWYDDD